MISNRPYAPRKPLVFALEELRRCAGTQFDPTVVRTFQQVLADRAKPPTASAVS
jgi:HD-GYP domain-containing protein (c-di-GMP phosphodiesterase class II)